MGTAASAVYLGTPQGALYWAVPRWETQQLLCQSERAGGGYVLSAGKRTCRKGRYHGNAQSRKSDALGAADERSTGNGNGDRQ